MEPETLSASVLIDTDVLITQMELFVGCRNKTELWKTEQFLKRFQIIKLNEPISDAATELLRQYRLSHGLAIPDALIAATALFFEQDFITKNQRDYRFITGLSLLPYPCSSAS
jgi:predicted nucleic acid-binding protein